MDRTVPDLEHLFKRYYRAVVRFFFRLGFSSEEARDLTQDVFLRVYKSMDSYRGEAEWSYLQKTARRVALNEWRRQRTQSRLGQEVALEGNPSVASSLASHSPTREDELIREQRSRRLQRAIEELPTKTRICLQLRLAGLSYNEIQRSMAMTLDAVKGRLNDARHRLRTRLGDDLEGLDGSAVHRGG